MQIFQRYTKEGVGVDANAPRKKGIALFFEIVFHKLLKLIRANFLYAIVSVPMILLLMLFVTPLYSAVLIPDIAKTDEFARVIFDLFFSALIFNFVGAGPASASYSYIIRCFCLGEYVFLTGDGLDKFKENFKNAIMLAILDILVLTLFALAIGFWKNYGGSFGFVMLCMSVLILIFYLLLHSFAYRIMISFKCSFFALLKNAAIFTMAKLPMCLALALSETFIIYLMFCYLNVFAPVIYVSIGMIFAKLPLEFYCSEIIRDYINDNKKGGAF